MRIEGKERSLYFGIDYGETPAVKCLFTLLHYFVFCNLTLKLYSVLSPLYVFANIFWPWPKVATNPEELRFLGISLLVLLQFESFGSLVKTVIWTQYDISAGFTPNNWCIVAKFSAILLNSLVKRKLGCNILTYWMLWLLLTTHTRPKTYKHIVGNARLITRYTTMSPNIKKSLLKARESTLRYFRWDTYRKEQGPKRSYATCRNCTSACIFPVSVQPRSIMKNSAQKSDKIGCNFETHKTQTVTKRLPAAAAGVLINTPYEIRSKAKSAKQKNIDESHHDLQLNASTEIP